MAVKQVQPSVFFTDSVRKSGFSLRTQFAEHMEFNLVKTRVTATDYDYYQGLSMAVRDRLIRKWLRTQQTYRDRDAREVYYLSLEFLMGRLLSNTLINLDFYDECREVLRADGMALEDLMEMEYDMGLGNGGLGRLAACFLDSMATLHLPAFGYGIRYEYGIFRQEIRNGYQVEQPDNWLSYGNPWETIRPELTYRVRYFGRVESYAGSDGHERFRWVDTEDVLAVAWDVPVPGYKCDNVNNLRLWSAKSTHEFSFGEFDRGNYLAAVEGKFRSENISKVLYPNDSSMQGKVLRLQQEYFFVSASLQDILAGYRRNHDTFDALTEKVFIQLNDTHPSLAIPELMRILMDDEGLGWDQAWEITVRCFGYTNHTVVPEALEEWPVELVANLLPRHLQIIFEINHRFLEKVRREYSSDDAVIAEVSIVREHPVRSLRMANLAIVGSQSVNGVAALHTGILKSRIFPHFHRIFPGKFRNITNGITPRRWLKAANPLLAQCITERIGDGWITDLEQLERLAPYANDPEFRTVWTNLRTSRKLLLKHFIEQEMDVSIRLGSIFDAQIKRFHLYKRQLLNILHVISLQLRMGRNPEGHAPRTFIFSGKAAPAYHQAKLVIKLIHGVAARINSDPVTSGLLQVVFLPNYSVSLAERIIPATDLSEQISTAGYEASGTGNMKFALNGALTIGTLDGANVEIRDAVGDSNIFIFGLNSDEVVRLKEQGYRPRDYYERSPLLRETLDLVGSGRFNPEEPGIFDSLLSELMTTDEYCVLADFDSYVAAQEQAAQCFADSQEWARRSILNVARIGRFSSDRSIADYNRKIWRAEAIEIPEEAIGMI